MSARLYNTLARTPRRIERLSPLAPRGSDPDAGRGDSGSKGAERRRRGRAGRREVVRLSLGEVAQPREVVRLSFAEVA